MPVHSTLSADVAVTVILTVLPFFTSPEVPDAESFGAYSFSLIVTATLTFASAVLLSMLTFAVTSNEYFPALAVPATSTLPLAKVIPATPEMPLHVISQLSSFSAVTPLPKSPLITSFLVKSRLAVSPSVSVNVIWSEPPKSALIFFSVALVTVSVKAFEADIDASLAATAFTVKFAAPAFVGLPESVPVLASKLRP